MFFLRPVTLPLGAGASGFAKPVNLIVGAHAATLLPHETFDDRAVAFSVVRYVLPYAG